MLLLAFTGVTNAQLNSPHAKYSDNLHVKYMNGSQEVIDQLDMGLRPIGAWTEPLPFTLYTEGLPYTVYVLDFSPSDNMFSVGGEELPFQVTPDNPVNLTLTTNGTTLGTIERQFMAITEGYKAAHIWPVSAELYQPQTPDVWELAYSQVIGSSFSYMGIPSQINFATLHNDYTLPFPEIPEGYDAVYKLELDHDLILDARVSYGENGKVALYTEDFYGEGGPMATNFYKGIHYDDMSPFEAQIGEGTLTTFNMPFHTQYRYSISTALYRAAELEAAGVSKAPMNSLSFYTTTGINEEQPNVTIWMANVADTEVSNTSPLASGMTKVFSGNISQTPTAGWIEFAFNKGNFSWDGTSNVLILCQRNSGNYQSATRWQAHNPGFYGMASKQTDNQPYDVENQTYSLSRSNTARPNIIMKSGNSKGGNRGTYSYGPVINDLPLNAGTYYLVASSTTLNFQVSIDVDDIPCPEVDNFRFNPKPFDNTANVQPGNVTLYWAIPDNATSWRLVFGTADPPVAGQPNTLVTDWSDNMQQSYTVTNLPKNRKYYWHVEFKNDGCPDGVSSPTWTFTTKFDVPQNLALNDNTVFNDDQITLNWDPVTDTEFLKYHIYRNGEKIGETTATTYTDDPLAYNMIGYSYYVTAVYEGGESLPSNEGVVQVSGYGNIYGYVYGEDGTTGIAGATVTFTGTDGFGDPKTSSFTTDNQGYYNGNLWVGSYDGRATCEGYLPFYPDTEYPYLLNPIAISYYHGTEVIFRPGHVPDIWELACENATTFPFSEMPGSNHYTVIHNDYTLPFPEIPDGFDAVYKLVIDHDQMIDASISMGENGKVALYTEDFYGEAGPGATNNYTGLNQGSQSSAYSCGPFIEDLPLKPGTYYLVVSSTRHDFVVNINVEDMPCPEVANFEFQPQPADNTANIDPALVNFSWRIPDYTTRWRLVLGTTDPPVVGQPTALVTDWFDNTQQSYTVSDLLNNRNYYWHIEFKNDGCPDGVSSPTWMFTTELDVPQNLIAVDSTVFNDEQITLSWETITDTGLQTYYIYRDDEKIGESTTSTYTDGPLAYNMAGYNYHVTAVYELGESAPSNTVNVQVSGYGDVNGHVYEQDGQTGISGVTVSLTGTDEFGDSHTYSFTTNSNGYYSGHIYAGSYNGQASHDSYQTIGYPMQGNPVVIHYNQTTSPINFMMDETFLPVPQVEVAYYPVEDYQSDAVRVSWTAPIGNRSLQYYRVYCTTFDNNGPYNSENTILVADNINDLQYVDDGFGALASGIYKYGVGAVYGGNHRSSDIQTSRESEIVWSNPIDRDLWLYNEVNITVLLNSADNPEGVHVILSQNPAQASLNAMGDDELEIILDETGYHAWERFRKGTYYVEISMEGYETIHDTVTISSSTDLRYVMTEILYAPKNVYVSSTGWATWEPGGPGRNRHLESFRLVLTALDVTPLSNETTESLYKQLPTDQLVDGTSYILKVASIYSTGMSEYVECTWRYQSCDHLEGFDNPQAIYNGQGVTLSWTSPESSASTLLYRDGEMMDFVTGSGFFDAEGTLNSEYTLRADHRCKWRGLLHHRQPLLHHPGHGDGWWHLPLRRHLHLSGHTTDGL